MIWLLIPKMSLPIPFHNEEHMILSIYIQNQIIYPIKITNSHNVRNNNYEIQKMLSSRMYPFSGK